MPATRICLLAALWVPYLVAAPPEPLCARVWRPAGVPVARAAGAMDYLPALQGVVLFGGRDEITDRVLAETQVLALGLIPGDLDLDRQVGLSDLAILLQVFGAGPEGDLDGDGATTLSDLASLLSLFGERCP